MKINFFFFMIAEHEEPILQNALVPESDNVAADSEDSEEEWNYYRPNKENGDNHNIDVEPADSAITAAEVKSSSIPAIPESEELMSDLLTEQQPLELQEQQQNIIITKDPALVEKLEIRDVDKEPCSPEDKPNFYDDLVNIDNHQVPLRAELVNLNDTSSDLEDFEVRLFHFEGPPVDIDN